MKKVVNTEQEARLLRLAVMGINDEINKLELEREGYLARVHEIGNGAMAAILAEESPAPPLAQVDIPRKRMSRQARQKISRAMRARWQTIKKAAGKRRA